jgi:hypothetical protein
VAPAPENDDRILTFSMALARIVYES